MWQRLFEYSCEAYVAIFDGKSVSPTIVTPFDVKIVLPFCVNSQFPPCSAAKSTITDPFFIIDTVSFGNNFGAG